LQADGGTIRLQKQAGPYRVTVFTSPTPLRAGLVDVSLLVQDVVTGEYVPQVWAILRLTARKTRTLLEYPATAEASTNKLYIAADFRLPESGWWDVAIAIEGPQGSASLQFEVQAENALPRWQELWPWFGWPALVVGIFMVHRALVRRTRPPSVIHPTALN
jgi:hypothetical protein